MNQPQMRSEAPGSLCCRSEITFQFSPLNSLRPYNLNPGTGTSHGEAVHLDTGIYPFIGDPSDQKYWIIWDLSIEEVLHRVIETYGWNECFHPMDLFIWKEVFDHFLSGDFFSAGILKMDEEFLRRTWDEISKLPAEDIELVRQRKLEWKTISYCLSRGLRLDPFTRWCLARDKFSRQSQIQLVESFCKFFRRSGLSPEAFLTEHKSKLEEVLPSKREFQNFLMEQTSPKLYGERKHREQVLQSLILPGGIKAEFDPQLEIEGFELRLHLESERDVDFYVRTFQSSKFQEDLRAFFKNL